MEASPSTRTQLPPIPAKRYFTIGEVSELCGVKPHVLRYWLSPLTLGWFFRYALAGASLPTLQGLHLAASTIHDLTFFFFLCFLPMGKHFHVITSLFNVFFMRLDTGNVKPVRHGVDESRLDEVKSFGVKKFEDFTWKPC